MINHELAKILKGAGFPQDGLDWYCPSCETHWNDGGQEGGFCDIRRCNAWNNKYSQDGLEGEKYKKLQISLPTLEKLIEACDEGFNLTKDLNRKTRVYEYTTDAVYTEPREWFKTAERAVAELWLKLNKNA